MKANAKFISLMVALAAGVAAAAPNVSPNTTNTQAGVAITNVASASFTDPANAGNTLTSDSNQVSTTVLALPSFDVVYDDGTVDGNTLANTPKVVTGAVPGQVVTTDYDIVNTGNTPLTVTLRPNTTGSATNLNVKYLNASGQVLTPNADGSYTLALPAGAGGVIKFSQQLTVPSDAPANATYGASPEALVTGTGTGVGQNGVPTGSTLYENQTVSGGAVVTTPAQGADLQFVKITTFQPDLVGSPNIANPTNPVGPDGTTAVTPPPQGSANVPTVTAGTPNRPDPTNPVTTAYPSTPSNPNDPTSGGTPIVVDAQGNRQVAYPKADNDNNPTTPNAAGQTNDQPGKSDVIIFTNDLKNNSTTTGDTVQLFPAGPDGMLLAGTTFNASTGVFTLPGGIQVRFLGPTTGAPIPVGAGAVYPTVTVPAGSTVIYRTEVTLPDTDDSSRIDPISVIVGADSLKDADLKADTTSIDTINSAAAQFGDTTDGVLGASPTPAPTQVVVPGTNTTTNISNSATDNVAAFPMDVANMGAYTDSFTLSATVAGLPAGATITYVDSSGNPLPTNGAGNFVTPVVAAGAEIKVFAVITVPDGTAAGTYTVSQKAVGNYSTITMTDLNDAIQVGAVGNVAVAKFTQDGTTSAGATPQKGINNPTGFTAGTTTVLPTSNIVYRIIGKNNYNAPVSSFALNDTVPANTTFQAASLTVNGAAVSKVIYKIGNGGWSATAPTVGAAAGTVIAVAADANNDNQPDALPAASTMELTFTVKVN